MTERVSTTGLRCLCCLDEVRTWFRTYGDSRQRGSGVGPSCWVLLPAEGLSLSLYVCVYVCMYVCTGTSSQSVRSARQWTTKVRRVMLISNAKRFSCFFFFWLWARPVALHEGLSGVLLASTTVETFLIGNVLCRQYRSAFQYMRTTLLN